MRLALLISGAIATAGTNPSRRELECTVYSVDMSVILAVLHVVSGIFIVGPMAVIPMIGLRALRSRQPTQVAALAKLVTMFTLLSLVVVFFGFGALGRSYSLASTWIWLSLVFYVVAVALDLFVVVPALQSAAQSLETGTADGGRVAGYSRISAGSGIAALLLVAIAVLMVWKP